MLPKKYRLRKNRDFRHIYKGGKSLSNQFLVLYLRKNNLGEKRVGFSISKKIGKANERNLLKRQLREAFKKSIPYIKDSYDLIFIARQPIKNVDFKTIESSVKTLLIKGKLIDEN